MLTGSAERRLLTKAPLHVIISLHGEADTRECPQLFRSFERRRGQKILGAKLGANGHSLQATPGYL